MNEELQVNDIVQITDPTHPWFTCLLQVDEVRSWGVIAELRIPNSNIPSAENVGSAYNRLNNGTFEKVGTAVVVPEETDD